MLHFQNPEIKPLVDAHESSAAEGVDGAVPARVADERNRVLGAELSPEEEEQHAALLQAAKMEELVARQKFDIPEPRIGGNVSKQIAQARWVLTRKMVDGRKSVKARLVAEGYQGPDVQDGVVDSPGCLIFRWSRYAQLKKVRSDAAAP